MDDETSRKTISLIVPTYNMADYISHLWSSLETSGTAGRLHEVLFVNDGSTDGTVAEVRALMAAHDKVRLVDLGTNQGRFVARLRGTEEARGSHVMFVDTRVALMEGFGEALARLLNDHDALLAMVYIDVSKSVYNLYWQRTHERIFRKHFEDVKKGFALTPANFEDYTKGTTCFVCPRADFLRACEKFRGRPLHSDDTFLMREIVETTPIWVDDRLRIGWEPRQSYWEFIKRLWERGPQFVEYHVFERRGLYFFLFVGWAACVLTTLFLLLFRPAVGLLLLAIGIGILSASTTLFARSATEFFRMLPIHVGTILAYGLGAIYGVGVNLNILKKPAPTPARR